MTTPVQKPTEIREFMPSVEESAKRHAIYAIDNALGFLAAWCPHGGDSERVGDYFIADEVRGRLREARTLLVGRDYLDTETAQT